MSDKDKIRIEEGSIIIPAGWGIEEFRDFAARTDTFFEEEYDSLSCLAWTQICVSGTGIIIDISVMDSEQRHIGSICIYEEQQGSREGSYVFNGYDLYPEDTGDPEENMDYLDDIAAAFFRWIEDQGSEM
mgnify:CR=1 FL=1